MGDTHRDLTLYLQKASAVVRARFVEQYPHPFVVRITSVEATDNAWADDLSFTTHVPGMPDEDDEDRPEHATIIARVVKREGGPFPDRIGVGRARNCDVTLRFSSVSKLHAQLRIDEGRWSVFDLDSANGTFHNGARVKARTPVPIQYGDRLRFGDVEVDFIDAGALFDLLRARKA